MKSFEVKAIGIEEISAIDEISISGGSLWKAAKKLLDLLGAADLIKEFRDGWNEAGGSLEYDWK